MKNRKPLSLANKIVIGLLSGIFFGFLVGEYASFLQPLGDAFVGLLQMTVLPIIFFSLILNIGKLSVGDGRNLVKNGLFFLGILLGLGLVVLMILPLALPEWNNSSFFSTSMIVPKEKVDFINLYIPSNPFYSLSAGLVPAIVIFSIFLGVALLKVEKKSAFLEILETIISALNQINKMVVKLSPYGVFAIAANMVISMSLEELEKLQGYIIIYTLTILILSFWTLPQFISNITPFTYREFFKYTKAELLTIFATSKIIVVLPQLIEDVTKLFKSKKESKELDASIDIMMPLAYPFPNLGTFLILFFVPFGAWYSGMKFDFSDYPVFLGAGAMSSFTAPITFIPFLLDTMEIPADLFNLFVVSTVYTDRIRVVLGAIFLVTLTIATVAKTYGLLKVNWTKLAMNMVVTVVLFAGGLALTNMLLKNSLKSIKSSDQIVMSMKSALPPIKSEVFKKMALNPDTLLVWEDALDRIHRRGKIRVGYFSNHIPFSYFNAEGELVGHDIDMANRLATDLKVEIEFLPVDIGKHQSMINRDYYDIIMSGVPLSGNYAENVITTTPYMDVNLALLVKDNAKGYENLGNFLDKDTVIVGYIHREEFALRFQSYCPNVIVKKIHSADKFYQLNSEGKVDAMITSFENGSIMTMLKPEYKVVNPLPFSIAIPMVYPIGNRDENLKEFVSNWITVKQKDGTSAHLYDHWILGKKMESKKKKWSIIRNVFHWVD